MAAGPHAGERFAVEVPTHVSAVLDFAHGTGATATWSFESSARRAQIEVFGTDGTLVIADPTFPHGPVRVDASDGSRDLPLSGPTIGRGIGVLDMARALRDGRPHRAAGDTALHVLRIMAAIAESAEHAEFRTVD